MMNIPKKNTEKKPSRDFKNYADLISYALNEERTLEMVTVTEVSDRMISTGLKKFNHELKIICEKISSECTLRSESINYMELFNKCRTVNHIITRSEKILGLNKRKVFLNRILEKYLKKKKSVSDIEWEKFAAPIFRKITNIESCLKDAAEGKRFAGDILHPDAIRLISNKEKNILKRIDLLNQMKDSLEDVYNIYYDSDKAHSKIDNVLNFVKDLMKSTREEIDLTKDKTINQKNNYTRKTKLPSKEFKEFIGRHKLNSWNQVELFLIDSDNIKIRIDDDIEEFHYSDLGFAKGGHPGADSRKSWALLSLFMKNPEGLTKEIIDNTKYNLLSDVSVLRKDLKYLFNINDDPFDEESYDMDLKEKYKNQPIKKYKLKFRSDNI